MTSPTRCTPSVRPSAARFSTAASVGAKHQRARWSVDDPIDLLRHPAVERAQPGLHVRDRHVHLGRHERRRQRRVRVAVDDDRIGRDVAQRALQRDEHPARLLRCRSHHRSPASRPAARNPSSRKKLPAIASSQCCPVSMKTSSCRSRSADWSAAALMSCGRVPTTFASRIRRRSRPREAPASRRSRPRSGRPRARPTTAAAARPAARARRGSLAPRPRPPRSAPPAGSCRARP